MLVVVQNVLHSYELDCPSCLQRQIRRNAKCNTSDGYMCLFDENKEENIEVCRNKPEFEQPGKLIKRLVCFFYKRNEFKKYKKFDDAM